MEIRAYSPDFQFLGIVEEYSSLLWTRRYSKPGDFELHTTVNPYTVSYLQRGNIISYEGAEEAGVIEYISASESKDKNEYVVSGRFLESYLDRRLIYVPETHTFNFSGRVEVGMRTILENVQNTNPLPLFQLGTLHGFAETISFQATYQNLLKYESKLADSAGLGFRCIPDFSNKAIIFDVYKGEDHSESQSERVRVTFSDEYRNIDQAEYTENDQLLKTVCFVGGRGEGTDRVWVVAGDDTTTGYNRREVKLDATDIEDEGLTPTEYKAKLAQRGQDLLDNEDILVRSFECSTLPLSNFIYKDHYDIGDIVTVKKDNWGISLDLRITEIQEVYEHGTAKITPTFGNPLPETIDWEDK